MRSLLVVFDHPPVSRLADFGEIAKEVQVEQFIAIRPVEALDVSILVRFAGLDVLDHHAGDLSPGDKFAAQEFGAIIDAEHLREPTFQAQSLKDPDQAPAGDGCVDLDLNG